MSDVVVFTFCAGLAGCLGVLVLVLVVVEVPSGLEVVSVEVVFFAFLAFCLGTVVSVVVVSVLVFWAIMNRGVGAAFTAALASVAKVGQARAAAMSRMLSLVMAHLQWEPARPGQWTWVHVSDQ